VRLVQGAKRIVKVFSELKDPQTGDKIFHRVLKLSETGTLRLFNEKATGDVWLSAKLGWHLHDEPLRSVPAFAPGSFFGQHGYDPNFPEMRAIFVAAGPGIKEKLIINPVRLIDVAPTAAKLLNITLPATVDGKVLTEILK